MARENEAAAIIKVKALRRLNQASAKKCKDWELAQLVADQAKQEYEDALLALRDEFVE